MFKLARVWTRIRALGSGTEYNPSVLDHMPKGGLVGYTTNNPQLAYLLLSEPAERFNFHVKDFSRFGSNLPLEQKVMVAGAKHKKLDFGSMYGSSNLDSGDVFDSDTVFTHRFPATVDEAKRLEEIDGGVNLFMHIEFENGVGENWEEERNEQLLECKNCGKIVRAAQDSLDSMTGSSELIKSAELDETVSCNVTNEHNWQDRAVQRIEGKTLQNDDKQQKEEGEDESSDLHSYFDDQGLLVKFKVDSNMELSRARIELLRRIAGGFKL